MTIPEPTSNRVKTYLLELQDAVCNQIEIEDGDGKFLQDRWERAQGGGGISAVMEGTVFERVGVNYSHVFGGKLPPSATAERPELAGCGFEAMGVSIVAHPRNPYAPTAHMNVRYFEAKNEDGDVAAQWFGGGYDLTPYYGFEEDAQHFHQVAKVACDEYGVHLYPQFKENADKYFYLKHRQEPRGIGGVFFDDFLEDGFEHSFGFMRAIGDSFAEAYLPIVGKRKGMDYGDAQRDFQKYRRGRYVEFNLVYDRGTHFGLQSGGRTESILMSLPPDVSWRYDWKPEAGTEEARLYDEFLKPRDWLGTLAT